MKLIQLLKGLGESSHPMMLGILLDVKFWSPYLMPIIVVMHFTSHNFLQKAYYLSGTKKQANQ